MTDSNLGHLYEESHLGLSGFISTNSGASCSKLNYANPRLT